VNTGDASGAQFKDYEEEQKSWLDYLVIPGFTLRRAWMLSQILFFAAMTCTVFVRTVEVATILIGLVGITWALTLWAPWAIISAEISRRDAEMRERKQRNFSPNREPAESPSSDDYSNQDSDSQNDDEDADQAGVILGIHNMAIAAPQIIATVASSIIFRFFQKPRGTPGDHSIAIVMALGGIAVLISAYFIHLIKDEPAVTEEDQIVAVEEGESSTRPSTSHSRTRSFEGLPRTSLERATLVRNASFGGAEY
jgi:solute carrier family 45 protein 1/2/4